MGCQGAPAHYGRFFTTSGDVGHLPVGGKQTMSRHALILLMLTALPAAAESGSSNIHLDLGGIFPPYGGTVGVGYDYQFKPGYALDFSVGGGYLAGGADFGFFQTTAGFRFRFLDNKEGYLNQKGGDGAGNLFLVPRVGVIVAPQGGA